MSRYYLGIDGGGTKTEAVIIDNEGHVLGIGVGGSSNVGNIGVAEATDHILQAVQHACAASNITGSAFDVAFLGIAGVVSEADKAVIRHIALQLDLASENAIGVDHDCRIALAGGLGGDEGIVQILGTGSSCFGMQTSGERWMSGGWGHLIADEGGGYWFGIQAMKAAVAAYDGRGKPTLLLSLVMEALGISRIEDIMQRLYTTKISVSEIAALSPLVIHAAQLGDATACAIIADGMNEVARCVEAVARTLNFAETVKLTCVGGMTQAGDIILKPLAEAVHRRLPSCQLQLPLFSPAIGAALLARQSHQPLDDNFLHTLRHSQAERA